MVKEVPITQSRLSINARVQETGGPTGGAKLSQNIAGELRQRRDQYQEQAIENAYLRGQSAITEQMQKIEQEYAFDPDGMTAALDEYSETFLEEVSDPNMAERFRLQITRSGGAAIAQATARRQKVISDQTRFDALQAIDSINKALPNMVSAMTSPDPAVSLSASEAVQEQLLRAQQIANQTDENGQFIFTPNQRYKMIAGLKDQVAFQRAIANPAEYKDFLDGSLIVSLPNAGESTMKTSNRLFTDLKNALGISDVAAAGIVGNLAHESNGFLQLQELDPLIEGARGGFGFAQWTGPRREAFESWAQQNNLDPSSYEANVGFLVHELKNTAEGSVLTELEGAGDALEATKIFSDKFLRPGIPHMKSRLAWTQKLLTTENEDVDLVNVRQTMSPDMIKLAKSTIESNIKASREADVITQVSNETSLLDVINDQSLPIAERILRVRQADTAGEISDDFAGEAISLLNSQKSTKKNVPNEEKLVTFQRMSDSLANLRIAFGGTVDSVSDKVKLNSENIKQYKAYKLDVIKEVERGALTVAEGKKLLDGVQAVVTEAVEANRTNPDGFRLKRGVQDPHGEALDKIDKYLKAEGASGDIARKRELFLRFSDNLGEYDEQGNYQVTGQYASSGNTAKDEQIITEALTRAIMSMNNKNFVGRIDANNPPNQVVQRVPSVPPENVFETVEQMEAANLPDGTPVIVGGVRGKARK